MATYTAFIFSLRFCGLVDTSIEDNKTLFPPLQTGKIAHTALVFSAITRETGHSMTTRIMNSRGEGCPSPQAKKHQAILRRCICVISRTAPLSAEVVIRA